MKITIETYSEKACEENDYCGKFVLKIDGKKFMSFYDGEPEDSNLGRNFNDVFSIPELIQRVYDAGKSGEVLEIEDIETD
jgi:hypothetical protein